MVRAGSGLPAVECYSTFSWSGHGWRCQDLSDPDVHYHAQQEGAGILTTGNRGLAECKILCRVSKIGHSAKTFFAECRTRQRITLGKEFVAECRALGKEGHSAKDFFAECQALGKSAALGIGYPA